MANYEIVQILLKNKWSQACVSYGTKTDPDPRDGFFRYMCVGNNKRKEGYEDDGMAYEKMTRLQKVLKTPCRVELVDTEYVIGASMYVRKENFDRFWEELCEIRHLHLL